MNKSINNNSKFTVTSLLIKMMKKGKSRTMRANFPVMGKNLTMKRCSKLTGMMLKKSINKGVKLIMMKMNNNSKKKKTF